MNAMLRSHWLWLVSFLVQQLARQPRVAGGRHTQQMIEEAGGGADHDAWPAGTPLMIARVACCAEVRESLRSHLHSFLVCRVSVRRASAGELGHCPVARQANPLPVGGLG